MRVRSVSSSVRLPELPDARMETRKPIGNSPKCYQRKTFQIIADLNRRVNAQEKRLVQSEAERVEQELAGETGTIEGEAVERAKNSHGDAFRLEELFGERLDFLGRDRVNRSEDFIE
jgi:hypothetical protein